MREKVTNTAFSISITALFISIFPLFDNLSNYNIASVILLGILIYYASSVFFKKINFPNYSIRIAFTTVILLALGIILMIQGILNQPTKPIFSSILINFSYLIIFTSAYGCYSEFFFKQSLFSELNKSISNAIITSDLNDTITQKGLQRIDTWDDNSTLKMLLRAKKCTILSLYNLSFFKSFHKQIAGQINKGLKLNIIMLDPDDNSVCQIVGRGYEAKQTSKTPAPQQRAKETYEIYLKDLLFNDIDDNHKKNLKIFLMNRPPNYSAYLFDDDELWFSPRHSAKGKKNSLIFKFKNVSSEDNIFVKDIEELIAEMPNEIPPCTYKEKAN